MALTHLYAIVPADKEVVLDVMGVDNAKVRTATSNNFTAIYGGGPLGGYRGVARKQAVKFLLAHQRVVETAMRDHVVLPVKFGTVLPDEERVTELLIQGGELFRLAVKSLANRVQMEVVVLWNLQDVYQEISKEEAIVQLKARAESKPKDESAEGRITVGRMAHALLEKRRSSLRNSLAAGLADTAADVVVNPSMDDSVAANLALLIDRNSRPLLDERMAALDQKFNGKMQFRCVGPLPPYSFASVEVQVPAYQDVDKARRLLELGEAAAPDEIKNAYHRMAGQVHPDQDPDNPEAERRMSELSVAWGLLSDYSASVCSHTGSPTCGFDRPTVEKTLIITVRRQESRD